MGKRTNGDFEKHDKSLYDTPLKGAAPLFPHLTPGQRYVEPCAGNNYLIDHLTSAGFECTAAFDIVPKSNNVQQRDFKDLTAADIPSDSIIITNPPWDRPILHPMIDKFMELSPVTWLLFDADWIWNVNAWPRWQYCDLIVPIGRLKWIENTKYSGFDNCAWYRFTAGHMDGPRIKGRVKTSKPERKKENG